ncbi:hypothetical protein ACH4S8_37165 [Streptomyces sp. NPDC021080]|uniref:hypothetical protein n=1 Tax=Streptomyces sp. NPDC021080 TaxID=3365110 RepID=UPI0037B756B1
MPEKIEKRAPTRDDVLTPRIWQGWSGVQTRPNVVKGIVVDAWKIEGVYDTRTAAWYVKAAALDAILAELVADGTLVTMDGWALEELDPSLPITRTWTYYMLPERAQELRDADAARKAEEHRAAADAYARDRLVEKHPQDYLGFIQDYEKGAGR